jgi:hypothetical protein
MFFLRKKLLSPIQSAPPASSSSKKKLEQSGKDYTTKIDQPTHCAFCDQQIVRRPWRSKVDRQAFCNIECAEALELHSRFAEEDALEVIRTSARSTLTDPNNNNDVDIRIKASVFCDYCRRERLRAHAYRDAQGRFFCDDFCSKSFLERGPAPARGRGLFGIQPVDAAKNSDSLTESFGVLSISSPRNSEVQEPIFRETKRRSPIRCTVCNALIPNSEPYIVENDQPFCCKVCYEYRLKPNNRAEATCYVCAGPVLSDGLTDEAGITYCCQLCYNRGPELPIEMVLPPEWLPPRRRLTGMEDE